MEPQRDEADYVVVGAGPAGCAVAARLAEAGWSVALFETGPERPSVLSRIPLGIALLVPYRSPWNYGYRTVPQAGLNGRRGYQPRGRGVGGSSLINAMIYIRGQPQDYDGWAELGCTGWGWSDVLPYFLRSEANGRGASDWHGAQGPLAVSDLRSPAGATAAFIRAGVEAGFPANPDFNGPSQEGFGAYQVFQKEGRRWDAGQAYLLGGPVKPGLRVFAGRPVRRVLFEGRRAVAVAHGRPGREEMFRARREIILSAGAFGSPQLLMLSGIGPAAELRRHGIPVEADLPAVGENLQDHCDYVFNLRARGEGLFGYTLPVMLRSAGALVTFLRRGEGMFTTNAAEGGGFVRSRPELDRPDLQLHFCIGLVDDHNRRPHFATGFSLHVCALRPKSRGRVSLGGPRLEDAPLIDPNFLSDPDDFATLLRGVEIGQRILAQPSLAAFRGRPLAGTGRDDPDTLAALIRERADTIYHPVGTCRMGADPSSVVDPQLRVRGVDGLRVADASIMPTLVSGNTQAPSAMIGEKAADLLLGRLSPRFPPRRTGSE